MGAVQQNGAIQFLFDLGRGPDENLADGAAFRAGLFGDKHIAQHGFGVFKNFLRRLAKFDPALESVLERSLAATAGVDLGFDDGQGFALGKQLRGIVAGGRGLGKTSAGGRATPYWARSWRA